MMITTRNPDLSNSGIPEKRTKTVFLDFMPAPASPAQWLYPEDDGVVWDGAHSESEYSEYLAHPPNLLT